MGRKKKKKSRTLKKNQVMEKAPCTELTPSTEETPSSRETSNREDYSWKFHIFPLVLAAGVTVLFYLLVFLAAI